MQKLCLVVLAILVCGAVLGEAPSSAPELGKANSPGVRIFLQKGERGDVKAQVTLGASYESGVGVPQDLKEAAKWYRKAAEQGDPLGQDSLGALYEEGRGVPQNYQEAVKWYRKSAEQGDAGGQFSLGRCYEEGKGVPQDNAEAYFWMNLAAISQSELAFYRDHVAAKLSPATRAEVQTRCIKWMAAFEKRKTTNGK